MNFHRTIGAIFRQRFVNPYIASARHAGWQIRKLTNGFPHDIGLGNAVVRVANRSVANGCGALVNALRYYDPNNMGFLREIFGSRTVRTFFDVGANIGVYSIVVAAEAQSARVVAFEPHPGTFALLQENVHLNEAGTRVHCLNAALGDTEGTMTLEDRPGDPTNRVVTGNDAGAAVVSVECRRGDAVCAQLGLVPDVVKIDVEGFENAVLRGFAAVLKKISVLLIESKAVDETSSTICKLADFEGPYKIDLLHRRFSSARIHEEDWLYLNRAAAGTFVRWRRGDS